MMEDLEATTPKDMEREHKGSKPGTPDIHKSDWIARLFPFCFVPQSIHTSLSYTNSCCPLKLVAKYISLLLR